MMETEVPNNSWFSKRTLGLAFWMEAPAILVLFYMFSFGMLLLLKEQGIDELIIKNIQISIIGLGVLVASTYIWLVSKNTSRRIYTILSRIYVLLNLTLFVVGLIIGIEV